ncbi:hypothetical protein [Citricoccus muralis]|uniref:Uncharacterized protein n=1 Tax=Citricoccus muralis TaxID=169134 RepID=A0ABY8H6H5_9MICC|nr:hypothetical protein [Citricoccus muralis]WFP16745.1 hypothetical protein P8192_01040 [Citricoccus muralis]
MLADLLSGWKNERAWKKSTLSDMETARDRTGERVTDDALGADNMVSSVLGWGLFATTMLPLILALFFPRPTYGQLERQNLDLLLFGGACHQRRSALKESSTADAGAEQVSGTSRSNWQSVE